MYDLCSDSDGMPETYSYDAALPPYFVAWVKQQGQEKLWNFIGAQLNRKFYLDDHQKFLDQEQVFEETVAKVLEYTLTGEYDPAKASVKTLACTIARRKVFNLWRKRNGSFQLSLDEVEEYVSNCVESVEESLDRPFLDAEISLLPLDRQTVIRMSLEGYSDLDIATALDKTVGAIRVLRHRAIGQLKESMS